MKNMYIILTLALFCLGCLYAVEADEYLIGAYSQWRVDYENSDPAGAFSTLREKLYEGGFNAVNYTVLEEINFSNDKLGAVLSSLHNGGNESVRTILTDFSWKNEPTNNKIGAYSLFGNYLKMEAEYQLKYEDVVFVPDVLPTNDNTEDDSYNTVFRHETGKLSRYDSDNYQNGFAWICNENDNHAAGMALSYPRFRWKPDNKNNPRTIGHDLKFRTRALAENKLYMTIALKVSGDETNIPIADIKFKVLKYASADAGNREWGDYLESDYYEFPLISTNPAAYSTTIYNREYPFVDIDDYGNHLFEYYIDLPPSDTALYEQLMGGYEFFFHLNPQVYWRGNGCLEIDYLVLQDEFQRTIDATRATNVYWGRLQSRLNQIDALDTNSNILYHYLMDEPFQGQFRMYDNIQNYMAGQGKDVMTATHLENPWLKKPNGYDNYKHYKLFLKEANPKIIALDSYPLQETGSADSDLIKWNHEVNDPRFVQTRIQEITIDHYHELTKSINDDNSPFSETKLIYIPQIFGERMGTTSVTRRWKYFMPPLSMIKCLQMLPLCYAADGILSFTIASNPNSLHPTGRYYRVAPLQHSSQGLSTLTIDPQSSAFAYLTDANRKIAKYGPIIRKLLWRSADSIMNEGIHQSTILSEYKLNDLSVVQSDIGHYEGYVQCGFYLDNYSLPTFMLVNRRSVFRTTSSNEVVQMPVDDDFVNAPPQTVCFEPDDPSHGIFGTHIALYDPYDDKIYKSTSGVIDVKIDPGDGKLLQMCSSLPQVVTNDADLKEIAYLAGSITIDQGAEVTIHPGTTTNIFADSTILVKDGSTLNISGTVSIANNVSIIVENGSNIIFDNAICNWGINSILKVENSGITANNTILQSANAGETWQGLRINNAGTIGMVGTTITGAKSNEVTNSQVLLTDCKFNIPTAGTGLSIINSLPNQNVRITSTTDSKGFYSMGPNSIGLFLENPNANLFLNNTVFDGLSFGFVSYLSSDVEDTIQNCYFSNNGTGLILQDLQNSPLISNCTFYQNAIGAHFYAASPKVTECEFTGCDVGIRTELATVTTGGIYDSIFSQGETAIVSRGSNQRVSKNTFFTNTGILNHSGSILNMGNLAKNLFKAEHKNIKFKDTHSYTARVQLYEGHNDFYHKNPRPLNYSIDLHFDSNYSIDSVLFCPINASYNWFEDNDIIISSPGIESRYAYCDYFDTSPNVFSENSGRMAQAMDEESAENYYSANNMYKTILDENEISEADLLFDALDAYYRTADLAGDTLSGTESYLLAKIDQYETDNPILTKYLEDYLVKNRLQAGDFQTAINLLELRILNAESPVDSLHAVMNLEIVLQLATMSESKRPISTKFTQYIYPDRLTFKTKHEEHWKLLDELLNDEEIDLIPIPDKALISSNYPNPFNPSTTIAYSVPKDGLVKIGIYNIKGQKVKELCNSEMLRGHHKLVWDGKDEHQRNVGSGVYFVKMQSGGDVSTRKIMLMK